MMSQGSQPGTSDTHESSSPQGPTESVGREKRQVESDVESEDEADLETVRLLDAAEALELVEFDPSINDTGEWEAPKSMSAFLQKHFNRSLKEEEREAIRKDFPKPAGGLLTAPTAVPVPVQEVLQPICRTPGAGENQVKEGLRKPSWDAHLNAQQQQQHLTRLGLSLQTLPLLTSTPPAGRLQHCTTNWERVTSDPWVLQTVRGHQLELLETPSQGRIPKELSMPPQTAGQVELEVLKLEQKGAIRRAQPTAGQFVSCIFAVPKKDGSQRPVVNLKQLNQFVVKQHFKMEGIQLVRDLLRKGDYMVSIDLKDAYLSVPILEEHRKYLRFQWRSQLFEFQVLPFGLSSAPRTFTKLLRPVMAALRQKGLRSVIFIDDLLLMAQSESELEQSTQEVVTLLKALGFVINLEKSSLTPKQIMEFLGFLINSLKMTLSLPEAKVKQIVAECRGTLQRESVSVRELARLIGRMSAASQAR